jgi:hypothetical protein
MAVLNGNIKLQPIEALSSTENFLTAALRPAYKKFSGF